MKTVHLHVTAYILINNRNTITRCQQKCFHVSTDKYVKYKFIFTNSVNSQTVNVKTS